MDKVYDLIIMGGGPGGMTAAIYAKRAGMDVVMIEKGVPGGAVATTYEVANYPGFTTISGMDLSVKMFEQTQALGIETIFDEIKSTNLSEKIKTVTCFGCELKGKTVLIAMGAAARRLNLDNERQFVGRGISYCATCDGALFKDKTVAVVGGGNSALEDAIYLSNLAKKVYLIHRRDEFRGEEILAKQVRESEKIELVLNSACWIRRISSRVCKRKRASRLDRGSSSSRIRGSFTRARAMATRCCCPPDSSLGLRSISSWICTSLAAS